MIKLRRCYHNQLINIRMTGKRLHQDNFTECVNFVFSSMSQKLPQANRGTTPAEKHRLILQEQEELKEYLEEQADLVVMKIELEEKEEGVMCRSKYQMEL